MGAGGTSFELGEEIGHVGHLSLDGGMQQVQERGKALGAAVIADDQPPEEPGEGLHVFRRRRRGEGLFFPDWGGEAPTGELLLKRRTGIEPGVSPVGLDPFQIRQRESP